MVWPNKKKSFFCSIDWRKGHLEREIERKKLTCSALSPSFLFLFFGLISRRVGFNRCRRMDGGERPPPGSDGSSGFGKGASSSSPSSSSNNNSNNGNGNNDNNQQQQQQQDAPQPLFDLFNSGAAVAVAAVMLLLHLFKSKGFFCCLFSIWSRGVFIFRGRKWEKKKKVGSLTRLCCSPPASSLYYKNTHQTTNRRVRTKVHLLKKQTKKNALWKFM